MNFIGKALVFLNLLLAVFFMTWAAGIYLNRVDWGWKDPRKHLDSDRIPSEIDKRVALLQQALSDRDRALSERYQGLEKEKADQQKVEDYKKAMQTGQMLPGGVLDAANDLALYQAVLWDNHRQYNEQLRQLESSTAPKIDIRQVKIDKGVIALNPEKLGQPVFGDKVTFTDVNAPKGSQVKDLNKSYESYRGDLKKVQDDIDTTVASTKSWVEKQQTLTQRLNGTKDEAGKTVKVGLYQLLDHEFEVQQQLRKEMTYLRPLWVRELVDAQLLLERRQGLQERLKELQR
jgi:hypothetical protein